MISTCQVMTAMNLFLCTVAVLIVAVTTSDDLDCADVQKVTDTVTPEGYDVICQCAKDVIERGDDCLMECVAQKLNALTVDGYLIPRPFIDAFVPPTVHTEYNKLFVQHAMDCNVAAHKAGTTNRCQLAHNIIACADYALAADCMVGHSIISGSQELLQQSREEST